MRKSPNKPLSDYARYTSMALQMAVVITVGVFGGLGLDRLTGWTLPVFTIVLSLLSVVLAIYLSVRDFIRKK